MDEKKEEKFVSVSAEMNDQPKKKRFQKKPEKFARKKMKSGKDFTIIGSNFVSEDLIELPNLKTYLKEFEIYKKKLQKMGLSEEEIERIKQNSVKLL